MTAIATPWIRTVAIVGFVMAAGLTCVPQTAHSGSEFETKVKAAYVYHVLKFVEWPQSVDNLRLCVIGTDAVAALLPELNGKQVKDRALRVDADTTDLGNCNAVFIGRSERRWRELVSRPRPAQLTISDQDGFTGAGGMVGFYADGGRIKLDINPDAARQASLKISAKLLEVARTAP